MLLFDIQFARFWMFCWLLDFPCFGHLVFPWYLHVSEVFFGYYVEANIRYRWDNSLRLKVLNDLWIALRF